MSEALRQPGSAKKAHIDWKAARIETGAIAFGLATAWVARKVLASLTIPVIGALGPIPIILGAALAAFAARKFFKNTV